MEPAHMQIKTKEIKINACWTGKNEKEIKQWCIKNAVLKCVETPSRDA
jgi:hypothetical protein